MWQMILYTGSSLVVISFPHLALTLNQSGTTYEKEWLIFADCYILSTKFLKNDLKREKVQFCYIMLHRTDRIICYVQNGMLLTKYCTVYTLCYYFFFLNSQWKFHNKVFKHFYAVTYLSHDLIMLHVDIIQLSSCK